jgi:hypothetical protein
MNIDLRSQQLWTDTFDSFILPAEQTRIRADDADDGCGDGDDLWKGIVLGGHDAHGWKLRDEDGKKKDALCCASAALLLLLYLTKIGGLGPNNEIEII